MWVVYCISWPFVVFEAPTTPWPIANKHPFKHGERVMVRLKGCKRMAVPNEITVALSGETIVGYPIRYIDFPVGCFDTVVDGVIIPSYVSAGEYKILVTFTYQVNPLRTITYRYETEHFEVVE